ncbi:uncharacterized protein LOC121799772 isoform X1 [Salvia splendens]|uniref:uncharacterized protein LOC121799772 isoform X1 n=1 Tax=Salvia splendens TaxID=180675 RepID=UPI001C27E10A|nr:uncharacterized protein LOC121799772 isoform X1 [Salvia splendens]
MGKQSKTKKQEIVGKGKVTPVQIAFIVDRYLSDNNYIQTRSNFRSEASHLIAKSPVQEAPKSLLSLAAILDEYVTLKEQKVLVDQERQRIEHEKLRVQNLLSGMQEAMNAYNTPPPPPSAGYYRMYNTTPAMISASRLSNTRNICTDYSTPITNQAPTKRKETKHASDGPAASKRSRTSTQSKDANIVTQSSNAKMNQEMAVMNSAAQSFAFANATSGSPAQGSNVVKCLFNQESPASRANSSVPKTPPRASTTSQPEKSASPLEISTATSSKDVAPQQIISANCTIISSETIRVSPNKQIAYYSIEKNQITCSPLKSNLKRTNVNGHVKGRLDFGSSEMPMVTENQTTDGNSTSESEKKGDILDLDFPNLDSLGLDFNLSEFLLDFDIGGDLPLSSGQEFAASPDSCSGSGKNEIGTTQITSEYSSTMAGLIGDTNMNLVAGIDPVSSTRSVTKCITIVSPVKNQRRNFAQN